MIHICRGKQSLHTDTISDTVDMFQGLRFIIHLDKSVLVPTKKLKFLGFILDSQLMRVSLTVEKADSLKAATQFLLSKNSPTIREVAEVIGRMVASFSRGPVWTAFLSPIGE